MKITVLWASLASYSVALYRELASRHGCAVQLIYQPPAVQAPYDDFDLTFCAHARIDEPGLRSGLAAEVMRFGPDAILMASWNFRHYMSVARSARRTGTLVIAGMDNQWHGTVKQWLGVASSPWLLKPAIDTLLVAGDRQAAFARRLGYDDVMYGLYAADTRRFSAIEAISARPRDFLYVGRLAPEKNVLTMLEAYAAYRDSTQDPWRLKIAGDGPLQGFVRGASGVDWLGFVQPRDLPTVMAGARCLILPSTFEPWGVVLHEAAAAGLPIICSHACGASTAFVRDGVNGAIVPPRTFPLRRALMKLASSSDSDLEAMSSVSRLLAELWTPERLAAYIVSSMTVRSAGADRDVQEHSRAVASCAARCSASAPHIAC